MSRPTPIPAGARSWAYGHDGHPYDTDAPKGLGRWEYRDVEPNPDSTWDLARAGYRTWYYVTPQGLRIPVGLPGPEPPPLPQPESKRQRCGCREGSHECGSCGQPYWVEVHGMADGWCTYCYDHG